jgi:CRISPR system Cascade subunit CasA
MASKQTVLDPVFVVDGRKRSLPWILHALEEGQDLRFDHLRPHQEHAWHLFLVQTAAMLGPTDDWDKRLRAVGDIWDVHPEPGNCGFFQPAGRIEDGYKPQTYLEREDIPGISANHRAKGHFPASLDYWLYVLVAAQTISRYYTHHRHSIRTSGGYGDRPYVSKVTGLSWPDRFKSDVSLARSMHGEGEGVRFLWRHLDEVDFFGDKSRLSFSDCHPLVVDSCRPYRMKEGVLYYRAGWPNEPLNTDIGDLHAELEDPWLPINTENGETERTTRRGFTYDIVRDYLAGKEIKTPALQRNLEDDCYFVAQSIAGDQGGSLGIHQRVVKLPADLSDALFPNDDTFDRRSKQYVTEASKVKSQALRPAIMTLAGDSDGHSGSYLDRYEARVDQDFFPHLFDHASDERGVELWGNHLCDVAGDLFREALPSCTDWEQKAGAETLFLSRISDLQSHEPQPSSVTT